MKLPEQAIKEFQTAWLTSFGEEIPYERAATEANALLQLYSVLTTEHLTKK